MEIQVKYLWARRVSAVEIKYHLAQFAYVVLVSAQ